MSQSASRSSHSPVNSDRSSRTPKSASSDGERGLDLAFHRVVALLPAEVVEGLGVVEARLERLEPLDVLGDRRQLARDGTRRGLVVPQVRARGLGLELGPPGPQLVDPQVPRGLVQPGPQRGQVVGEIAHGYVILTCWRRSGFADPDLISGAAPPSGLRSLTIRSRTRFSAVTCWPYRRPAPMADHGESRLLVAYLRPHRGRVLALAGVLVAAMLLPVAGPVLLGAFVNRAIDGAPVAQLTTLAAVFLVVTLTADGLQLLVTWLSVRLAWEVGNQLRSDLARKATSLELAWHGTHSPGLLIERIDGDIEAINKFSSTAVLQLLGNAVLLVGVLTVACVVDWRAGLLIGTAAVLAGGLLVKLRAVGIPAHDHEREVLSRLYGDLEERLGGLEDLRANGAGRYGVHRLHEHSWRWWHAARRAALLGDSSYVAAGVVFAIGSAGTLGLGVWLLRQGELSTGRGARAVPLRPDDQGTARAHRRADARVPQGRGGRPPSRPDARHRTAHPRRRRHARAGRSAVGRAARREPRLRRRGPRGAAGGAPRPRPPRRGRHGPRRAGSDRQRQDQPRAVAAPVLGPDVGRRPRGWRRPPRHDRRPTCAGGSAWSPRRSSCCGPRCGTT